MRLEEGAWLVTLVLLLIGSYVVHWKLAFYPGKTRHHTWAAWDEAAERLQAQEFRQWLDTRLGSNQRQFD